VTALIVLLVLFYCFETIRCISALLTGWVEPDAFLRIRSRLILQKARSCALLRLRRNDRLAPFSFRNDATHRRRYKAQLAGLPAGTAILAGSTTLSAAPLRRTSANSLGDSRARVRNLFVGRLAFVAARGTHKGMRRVACGALLVTS